MTDTFEAFATYDFDHDTRFQSGVDAILNQCTQEGDASNVMERAKWFYYSKFIKSFDYDEYLAWKDTTLTRDESEEKVNEKSAKLSFDEIAEMIASGKEIPGIRQIPNKLHEGAPSEPTLPARPKPWMIRSDHPASPSDTPAGP